MVEIDIDPVIAIVTILFGIFLGWVGSNQMYLRGKLLFADFAAVINEVNNALYDDKVSEEEFRKIWEAGKKFYFDILNQTTGKK